MNHATPTVPPPLPPIKPPAQLQRLLAQVTMGAPGERARTYRALVQRGSEALDALDAVFPGRLFLDGDLASLFVDPLEELAPLLEAIRHFGSDGLRVLERHARDPDPNHRLAVVRALFDFQHAMAGRALAELCADPDERVARGATLALACGRHPGGLKRARDAAVAAVVDTGFDCARAWRRCVWLGAGGVLAEVAKLPWRKARTYDEPVGELSWHPPAAQRSLLPLLSRNPELPLLRIRARALSHPERDVRAYAVDKLGRSQHGALAFDPDGTESFRRTVVERFKLAAFD